MTDVPPQLLRAFLAVCERRHFGAAARALGISQPALSRRVARLEELVGHPLLLRSSREVTLTAAGRELRDRAPEVLDALGRALAAVDAAADGSLGELRVVASSCGTADVVPALVDAFAQARPTGRVLLERGASSAAVPALLEDRADVAFAHLPVPRDAPVCARELLVDAWHAVLPAGHPSAHLDALPPGALAREPAVVLFSRASTPQVFDALVAHALAGRTDNVVVLPSATDELSMLLVARRRGLPTVVSGTRARTTSVEGARVLPFAGDPPRIRLGVLWRAGRHEPLVDAFVAYASEQLGATAQGSGAAP